jgi:hypothetical protein
MKKRILVTLTAVVLSSAGAMEAQVVRVQRELRRPEPQSEQRWRSEPGNRSERPARNVPPEKRMRRAMANHTRSGGAHINPEYFAAHYGYTHGFHFTDCGRTVFGGELYFNWNGAWFGIMGQLPGNWAFQTDYLYIGIGDDGNYYLFDAQFPNVAVQLAFVQNIGEDQAGADQDDGDQ